MPLSPTSQTKGLQLKIMFPPSTFLFTNIHFQDAHTTDPGDSRPMAHCDGHGKPGSRTSPQVSHLCWSPCCLCRMPPAQSRLHHRLHPREPGEEGCHVAFNPQLPQVLWRSCCCAATQGKGSPTGRLYICLTNFTATFKVVITIIFCSLLCEFTWGLRFMGINYYYIRANFPWPEADEVSNFILASSLLDPQWSSFTQEPTFPVTWLTQYYTALDVPQVGRAIILWHFINTLLDQSFWKCVPQFFSVFLLLPILSNWLCLRDTTLSGCEPDFNPTFLKHS